MTGSKRGKTFNSEDDFRNHTLEVHHVMSVHKHLIIFAINTYIYSQSIILIL